MGTAEGSAWSGWQRDGDASSTTSEPETADEELAAIQRRAATLGIPAWRVSVALGRPLPTGEGR
jgi:hypothetical protein